MGSLKQLMNSINALNERIGRIIAWLAIIMVLTQFSVVVMRYVFGIGSIMMQESVVYLHAFLFMIGSGYTLFHNGHVRVDIFYRSAGIRHKAAVDLFGVVAFLLPVCGLIMWVSWPYVADSWAVLEGSKETSGIQGVFLLKTSILVFCFLVALQGVSMAARSILVLSGAIDPAIYDEQSEGV